jgi:hypothetical protein
MRNYEGSDILILGVREYNLLSRRLYLRTPIKSATQLDQNSIFDQQMIIILMITIRKHYMETWTTSKVKLDSINLYQHGTLPYISY